MHKNSLTTIPRPNSRPLTPKQQSTSLAGPSVAAVTRNDSFVMIEAENTPGSVPHSGERTVASSAALIVGAVILTAPLLISDQSEFIFAGFDIDQVPDVDSDELLDQSESAELLIRSSMISPPGPPSLDALNDIICQEVTELAISLAKDTDLQRKVNENIHAVRLRALLARREGIPPALETDSVSSASESPSWLSRLVRSLTRLVSGTLHSARCIVEFFSKSISLLLAPLLPSKSPTTPPSTAARPPSLDRVAHTALAISILALIFTSHPSLTRVVHLSPLAVRIARPIAASLAVAATLYPFESMDRPPSPPSPLRSASRSHSSSSSISSISSSSSPIDIDLVQSEARTVDLRRLLPTVWSTTDVAPDADNPRLRAHFDLRGPSERGEGRVAQQTTVSVIGDTIVLDYGPRQEDTERGA